MIKRQVRERAIRDTKADRLFEIIIVSLLVLIMAVILYPLYFILIASFSDPYRLMSGEVIFTPKGFTLEAYENILKEREVWSGYMNTILYASLGTLYSLVLNIPASYALSRKKLPGRMFLITFFLIPLYFSGGIIPKYVLVKNLGLLNTRWSLIIPIGFSVFNMIIARTFYNTSIPDEIYEAAKIDGASEYRIFSQIVLPLSGAIIAVIALYDVVYHWNSYFEAMMYLMDSAFYPLQLVLRNILLFNQQFTVISTSTMSSLQMEALIRRQMMAETMKYALIFVSCVPVLIVYPFVQRFFVKGVMIGALKG